MMSSTLMRVLDTDVFIDLEHKHLPALNWYFSLSAGTIAIPGYAQMELYQSASNKQQMQMTDLVIAGVPIVWPSEAENLQAIAKNVSQNTPRPPIMGESETDFFFRFPHYWGLGGLFQTFEIHSNFRRFHLSHGLGLVDALIAATALSYNAILCTSNLKHFRHIPGLVTEQPYTR